MAAVVRRESACRGANPEGIERITQQRNSRINTFNAETRQVCAAFVDKMDQINRGRALFTRPDHLANTCWSITSQKRKRS